jgi:hypothetical protein
VSLWYLRESPLVVMDETVPHFNGTTVCALIESTAH